MPAAISMDLGRGCISMSDQKHQRRQESADESLVFTFRRPDLGGKRVTLSGPWIDFESRAGNLPTV